GRPGRGRRWGTLLSLWQQQGAPPAVRQRPGRAQARQVPIPVGNSLQETRSLGTFLAKSDIFAARGSNPPTSFTRDPPPGPASPPGPVAATAAGMAALRTAPRCARRIMDPARHRNMRDTVRRPAGPWTPAVHALLTHLHAAGFHGAPRPLGIDEHGREI